MSEYIDIEVEAGDNAYEMCFYTNLTLTPDGVEEYHSPQAMEEGSPLAQMLSAVTGIVALRIDDSDLIVRRRSDVPWHAIVADISAALKEFFL